MSTGAMTGVDYAEHLELERRKELLEQSKAILCGKTLLMTSREHLEALWYEVESLKKQLAEKEAP